MKIFILNDSFPPHSVGGAAVIAFLNAQECQKRGYDVTVITTSQKEEGVKEYMHEGIKVISLYSKYHERYRATMSMYNSKIVDEVAAIFEKNKPDIVHAHNIHEHISYAVLAEGKKVGARVFLTAHDAMLVHYGKVWPKNKKTDYGISLFDHIRYARLRFNPCRQYFIVKALKNVDKIFVVSEALARTLRVNGINNITVVHNGIDASSWHEVSTEVRKENSTRYGLDNKIPFLFGGRLSGAKGGDVILEALTYLIQYDANIVFVIAGMMDEYAQSMKQKAQELGLENNVIFTGILDRAAMPALYSIMRGVLVPSQYLDPFPTVVLEAMASKKPVIGTCYGGTSEMVIDRVTGFVIEPTAENIAESVKILAHNETQAIMMGKEGYSRVQKDFSLTQHIDTLITWYNRSHESEK